MRMIIPHNTAPTTGVNAACPPDPVKGSSHTSGHWRTQWKQMCNKHLAR